MADETRFPRELLSEAPDARLAYFRNKVIGHPHLRETHQKLWRAIDQLTPGSLIFVFGPTGVGKTTLSSRIEKQLQEASRPIIEQDPGHIPVVGMEVAAADADNFRWRDYYKRALVAVDEPMIDKKVLPEYQLSQERKLPGNGSHKLTSELRWALEQALRHRRPKAFIVDEAQHFNKVAGGRRFISHLDTLKSLANMTGVTHVLIGTYELLGFTDWSAQLDRRSYEIHFARYDFNVSEEQKAFKSILSTFQHHLPLVVQPDLVAKADFLYERTVGCVGVLKELLNRALTTALYGEKQIITQEILEQHVLESRKLLRMAQEISIGEKDFMANGDIAKVRSLLGLSTEPAKQNEHSSMKAVGERKPERDQVGRDEQAG
jgi:hypothetical protein